MYPIVASDLDGTLLTPQHVISSFTKKTLQALTGKGIRFVFATGRHHVDVAQIRKGLGIDAWMITSNGARVHNENDELIFSHDLDEEIIRELCEVVYDDPCIQTNMYCGDNWLTNRDYPDEVLAEFKDSDFSYSLFTRDNVPVEGVSKIFFSCDNHDLLMILEEKVNKRWGDRINASFSTLHCLEVMAGHVSKGDALNEVAQLFGLTAKESIAFGDGMNDREMLTMAGKGCIMIGAHQRLKEALPHVEVIGSNADDGVAHKLREIYSALLD